MATDRELLVGFTRRERDKEAALFEALSRALWALVQRRCPWRKAQFAELRSQCFVLLCDHREKGAVNVDEPLAYLPRNLLRQVLRAETRRQARDEEFLQEEANAPPGAAPDPLPQDEVEAAHLWAKLDQLAETLPADLRTTFAAVRAATRGLGPALPEALAIDRDQARVKLFRLKTALLPKAVDAGLFRRTDDGRVVVHDG